MDISHDLLVAYIQEGKYKQISEVLKPDQVTVLDENGISLLHWAAINNRVEIAKLLLKTNGSHLINSVGGILKEEPLAWACRSDKFNIVDLLIRKGSNLNHRNVYGHTPLAICVRYGNIHNAYLLLSSGCDVDPVDNNCLTPMLNLLTDTSQNLSVEVHRQMFRLLLNFGANVKHKDNNGNTALHLMSTTYDFDPYEALKLIDFGGYISGTLDSICLSTRNNDGFTPYDIARRNRNGLMLRFIYDSHMFRKLPKVFVVWLTAIAVWLSFFAINIAGIGLGFVFALTLFYIVSKFSQDTIIHARSRVPFGWAIGYIATSLWSYITFVRQHMNAEINLFIYINAALIGYTLYLTSNTVPKHLTPNLNRQVLYNRLLRAGLRDGLEVEIQSRNVNIVDDSLEEDINDYNNSANGIFSIEITDAKRNTICSKEPRLCAVCLCDKSEASTHCSKCDICVCDLDHHCDFVNNCIGVGNRRIFFFFCIFASCGCGLNAIFSLYIQHAVLRQSLLEINRNSAFLLNAYISILVSLWIFAIGMGQVMLVASETTTFEVMRKGRKSHLDCSCRPWSNLYHFIVHGTYRVTPVDLNKSMNSLTGPPLGMEIKNQPCSPLAWIFGRSDKHTTTSEHVQVCSENVTKVSASTSLIESSNNSVARRNIAI